MPMMLPIPSSIYSRQNQFVAHYDVVEPGQVLKVRFARSHQPTLSLPWREILTLWQQEEFQAIFTEALATVPFSAFFWETPPLQTVDSDQLFECAIVESLRLANISAEPGAFADYISQGRGSNAIEVFPNLGRDALLVVPCQNGPSAHYAHIATFVRSAPRPQVYGLWAAIARAIEQTLQSSSQPLWVSTSGLGVSWLHVRLDSTPKYYEYAPYKTLL